jgi:hypothetical protein
MGATLEIYSTLSHKEALDVEKLHQTLLDRLAVEDPDEELEVGELSASGMTSEFAQRIAQEYESYRTPLAKPLLDRLRRCRSRFSIDRPGHYGDGLGFQDASIYFLLERAGESLLDIRGKGLETNDVLLRALGRHPRARKLSRFAAEEARPRKPTKVRAAKVGELRAIRVCEAMQRFGNDDELRVDLKWLYGRLSPDAQLYARHLMEWGATSDAEAARKCELSADRLEAAVSELEAGLRTLGGG